MFAWMAATSPAMTRNRNVRRRKGINNRYRYERLRKDSGQGGRAPHVLRRIGTGDLIRRAEPTQPGQLGFFVHSAHQPVGEISPSTSLHELGATNWMQPSHWRPSFGLV